MGLLYERQDEALDSERQHDVASIDESVGARKMGAGHEVNWIDDQRFVIGDTTFLISGEDWSVVAFARGESTVKRFVVWKSRKVIDHYVELVRSLQARNIVELGIMKGGSTAFLAAVAEPQKLVAVDITEDEVEALEQFIDVHRLTSRVETYYGVDQGDHEALTRILEREFAGEQLDLVIDDASHQLQRTRTSFNVLFPHLRPGGIYIIEDWSWAHSFRAMEAATSSSPLRLRLEECLGEIGPPLTTLIFEIVVACATFQDVIATVEIDSGDAYITRGTGMADPGFDVAGPYAAASELTPLDRSAQQTPEQGG